MKVIPMAKSPVVIAVWRMRVGEPHRPGDGETLPRMVEVEGRRGDEVFVRLVMSGMRMEVPEEEIEAYLVEREWVRPASAVEMLGLLGRWAPRG